MKERISIRAAGFTMVELLVVIVVISLLAAIGVPQYSQMMQDTRRSEAITQLNQIAMLQEQFHSENGTYASDLTLLGFGAANWNVTGNGNYRFRVWAPTAAAGNCPITTCFRLQIRPENGSAQWGDDYRYELYSDGRRTSRICPKNSCAGGIQNGWLEV